MPPEEARNEIEMLPCAFGVTVVLTGADGAITMQHLSWEQFARLEAALGDDPDAA
jgi:hypothetical protein